MLSSQRLLISIAFCLIAAPVPARAEEQPKNYIPCAPPKDAGMGLSGARRCGEMAKKLREGFRCVINQVYANPTARRKAAIMIPNLEDIGTRPLAWQDLQGYMGRGAGLAVQGGPIVTKENQNYGFGKMREILAERFQNSIAFSVDMQGFVRFVNHDYIEQCSTIHADTPTKEEPPQDVRPMSACLEGLPDAKSSGSCSARAAAIKSAMRCFSNHSDFGVQRKSLNIYLDRANFMEMGVMESYHQRTIPRGLNPYFSKRPPAERNDFETNWAELGSKIKQVFSSDPRCLAEAKEVLTRQMRDRMRVCYNQGREMTKLTSSSGLIRPFDDYLAATYSKTGAQDGLEWMRNDLNACENNPMEFVHDQHELLEARAARGSSAPVRAPSRAASVSAK